jgi:hypothetical protein
MIIAIQVTLIYKYQSRNASRFLAEKPVNSGATVLALTALDKCRMPKY